MSDRPPLRGDVEELLAGVGPPAPDLGDRALARVAQARERSARVPRLRGLVAAVLALAVVAGLLGVRQGLLTASRAKPAPSRAASPAPPPSAPPASPWVVRHQALGSVSALVVDGPTVYALTEPEPVAGGVDLERASVAAVDRGSGAVRTSGPVPYASQIATAGGWVWLAGANSMPPGATGRWLYRLDPRTLRVMQKLNLPGTARSRLAGAGDQLWIAYGNRLEALDAGSGAPLGSYALPGSATSLSLAPDGKLLYVGVTADPAPAEVVEWDTAARRQVAAAATGGEGLGGPTVAAAADGVWVAFATGMLGGVQHFASGGLSPLPNAAGLGHTNGVRVDVVAATPWLVDAGAQAIACLDGTLGSIRASADATLPQAMAGDAAGVYLGTASGLDTLRPDPRCQAPPSVSPFAGVAWASLSYPIDCGGVGTVGTLAAYASPEPGTELAVVFATCRAGAGSPPSAILVFDHSGPGGAPRLRQTLVTAQDDWLTAPTGATASGKDLSVAVYGYSSMRVARCCPDLHPTLTWAWSGQSYVATSAEPAHH